MVGRVPGQLHGLRQVRRAGPDDHVQAVLVLQRHLGDLPALGHRERGVFAAGPQHHHPVGAAMFEPGQDVPHRPGIEGQALVAGGDAGGPEQGLHRTAQIGRRSGGSHGQRRRRGAHQPQCISAGRVHGSLPGFRDPRLELAAPGRSHPPLLRNGRAWQWKSARAVRSFYGAGCRGAQSLRRTLQAAWEAGRRRGGGWYLDRRPWRVGPSKRANTKTTKGSRRLRRPETGLRMAARGHRFIPRRQRMERPSCSL